MKTKLAVVLALLGCFICACSNSEIDIVELQGTIVDVRDIPAMAECEWVLDVNGRLYKPTYLPSNYREDGLEVIVKAELYNRQASCAFLNNSIETLRIEQLYRID
ncbi:hypothetical protein [Roseivirga thermotolerans]|uniref:Lipoprotein n=1 Tax=Roseivirga thermotolerans TaxID=1758176 RepID=A0ABQ3I1F4_9BACT|nr:hypothetical protein [Roseivirga thermotolerans]GHE55341.1 hypothetical protein GCM10011340_07600 [Roseivirga thermotolerans]